MEKNVNKATACLYRYCEENHLFYRQPNRHNLEENNDFVTLFDDESNIVWKYSIGDDKMIFPNEG